MIENFSVTFFSLKFSFCMAAIISAPTPFKRLCNFALYFFMAKKWIEYNQKFYPRIYPKEKLYMAMRLKFYPLTFHAENRMF